MVGLLGCAEAVAGAVLDLPWRQLTRERRALVSELRREVAQELARGRAGPAGDELRRSGPQQHPRP